MSTRTDPGSGVAAAPARRRFDPVPWVGGLVLAAAVMGPALGPGGLLNLDLVVLSHLPVPSGVWGLGPELPRKALLLLPVSWAGALGLSAAAWKALAVAALTLAFVGMYRRVGPAPTATRVAAALLYAASPFALTRLGIGHLALVAGMALLPWALPTLLRPADDPGRTFRWAVAFGLTGVFGGMLALTAVGVGIVADRGRGALRSILAVVAGQLPWILPGLAVLSEDHRLAGGASFPTDADGVQGALQVLAGHGFWQEGYQVGGRGGWLVALLGVALLGLALAGHRDLPAAWRARAAGAAAVGMAVTVSSAVPGLRSVHDAVTSVGFGASLRESQRLLPLFLVWLAPAAALGARRLAAGAKHGLDGAIAVVPIAIALVLAGPGLWAVGGELDPVDLPPEWDAARDAVEAEPGTVLALPWHQYLNLQVADFRRVHHPARYFLPGDVLGSSDPSLEPNLQEVADPRVPAVEALLPDLDEAAPVADQLADLGIRWVFVVDVPGWPEYPSFPADPDLTPVVTGPTLDLYRVDTWPGAVIDDEGDSVPLASVVSPLQRLDPSGPAVWNRPYGGGWLRGWSSASSTADGRVQLPGGAGLVWYWPAVVVLAGTLGTLGIAAVWQIRVLRARRPRTTPGQDESMVY